MISIVSNYIFKIANVIVFYCKWKTFFRKTYGTALFCRKLNTNVGAPNEYAHHLLFSRNEVDLNMLSFGLSVGFIQYKLDETSFLFDGPDPIIDGIVQSETNLNIDLGFSYHYLDFYAHATIKNLLENSGINNDIHFFDCCIIST